MRCIDTRSLEVAVRSIKQTVRAIRMCGADAFDIVAGGGLPPEKIADAKNQAGESATSQ